MNFETMTINKINQSQLEEASIITAHGFSRPNDAHNQYDTQAHIEGVDLLQVATCQEKMAGYVGFRRLLWQSRN
ncbi:MAG: hypothetical protein Q8T08_14890 [Ignavibacteria bacterium]|jgi:hypothetical protein|nr:hypothetical protein [Ignavibacteria bacterium]